MDKAVADLAGASDLAAGSGEVLREIVSVTETSADQIRGIATAAEEQASATEEISRSVERINEIAEQTNTSVGQAAAALRELSAQSDALADLVGQLKREAKG